MSQAANIIRMMCDHIVKAKPDPNFSITIDHDDVEGLIRQRSDRELTRVVARNLRNKYGWKP